MAAAALSRAFPPSNSLNLSDPFRPYCESGHIVSHIANGHVRHATALEEADRQSTEVQQFP